MSVSSQIGIGFRRAGLRLPTRSSTLTPLRLQNSSSRLYSSLLRQTNHRLLLVHGPVSSRNFSLWPSSKPTPPPVVDPVPPPPITQAVPAPIIEEPIATASSTSPPSELLPDSTVADTTSSLTETVTNAITSISPLHYGDLSALGLAGWSPAGFVRWSLELINVTTGFNWFTTIVVGATVWRLVCVPFAVKALSYGARMQPHQAEMKVLQDRIREASQTRNTIEMVKANHSLRAYYKEKGISPFGGLVGMVQVPISLGMFFGVKKLCNLPLPQLTESGVSWLPDLTVADTTWVLPLAFAAVVQWQIAAGVRDINTIERPGMGHLMNGLRVLSILSFFVIKSLPAGLVLSLLTTSVLTVLQMYILRIPALRRKLGIPIVTKDVQGQLPKVLDSLQYAKDMFSGQVEQQQQIMLAKKKKGRGF